jgi:hypothetical protein
MLIKLAYFILSLKQQTFSFKKPLRKSNNYTVSHSLPLSFVNSKINVIDKGNGGKYSFQ